MSSPSDPMRALGRRAAATWGLGIVAVAVSGWWAMVVPDMQRTHIPSVNPRLSESSGPEHQPDQPSLDVDSLVVRLWNPPPASVERPIDHAVTADASPPIRLQLIGIISEGDTFKAALYDPDSDRIHIVGDGSSIGSLQVTSVTASLVRLTDGDRTQSLELITGREGSSS